MVPPAEAVPVVDGLAKPDEPDGEVAAEPAPVEAVDPVVVEPVEVDPAEDWACAESGAATDARRIAMRTGVI